MNRIGELIPKNKVDNSTEAVSQLEKLYELEQKDILTEKEYDKQKKKMFLLQTELKQTSQANEDVFDVDGKKCGVVVRSHWSELTGSVTLAILSLSYLESNQVAYLDPLAKNAFAVLELNYDHLQKTKK